MPLLGPVRVCSQLAVPAVQVAPAGWALQGRVLDSNLQPLVRSTVFLVDANKDFLKQYGFAYTDALGNFVLNYAGDATGAVTPPLFIEVVDTQSNPVYLSPTQFVPIPGAISFQNIVLAPGSQPIGDPTDSIRAVAMPGTNIKSSNASSERRNS